MIEPSQVKLVANLILLNQLIARLFAAGYVEQGVTLEAFATEICPRELKQAENQTFVGVTPEIGDLLSSEYEAALATQMGLQHTHLQAALAIQPAK